MTNDSNINALINLGVGCYNSNGLGSKSKRDRVLNWLKGKKETIFFIQESHSTTENERDWRNSWGGDIIFNHGTSNSTGVAILFKQSVQDEIKILNHVHISPGRATLVDVESGGTVFGIINVYCPNSDDTSFLNSVFLEACSTTKSDNLIFAGDWNTVLNNNLDKAGGAAVHNNVNCQTLLNNIMGDWGFSDVFRLNNPAARLYTHFDKQHSTHTRLDFFLVDDKLVNLPVCSSNISHGFSSDHSYVSLNLQGNPLSHGRGYWKFNNSHLYSEEFTQEVREIIKDTVSGSYDSFNGLWDTIKYRLLHLLREKDKEVQVCRQKDCHGQNRDAHLYLNRLSTTKFQSKRKRENPSLWTSFQYIDKFGRAMKIQSRRSRTWPCLMSTYLSKAPSTSRNVPRAITEFKTVLYLSVLLVSNCQNTQKFNAFSDI